MGAYVDEEWKIPGISEKDLTGDYSEYSGRNIISCGFGLRHENFALDLDSHRFTEQYALAFNGKLKELIDAK